MSKITKFYLLGVLLLPSYFVKSQNIDSVTIYSLPNDVKTYLPLNEERLKGMFEVEICRINDLGCVKMLEASISKFKTTNKRDSGQIKSWVDLYYPNQKKKVSQFIEMI